MLTGGSTATPAILKASSEHYKKCNFFLSFFVKALKRFHSSAIIFPASIGEKSLLLRPSRKRGRKEGFFLAARFITGMSVAIETEPASRKKRGGGKGGRGGGKGGRDVMMRDRLSPTKRIPSFTPTTWSMTSFLSLCSRSSALLRLLPR